MIEWAIFSARIGLYSEAPRPPASWSTWAQRYHKPVSFRVRRRWRESVKATGRLDLAQRAAKGLLGSVRSEHPSAYGFVRGRSTYSAALPHVGAKLVLSVDLKDFYGQIGFARVADAVREDFDSAAADWIEGVCFLNGRLPLGFRTSPVLSNIAFAPTDVQIADLARQRNVTYTRWVDDLSFSGELVNDEFLADLETLLHGQQWRLNEAKTRFMRRSPHVLGLYVGHDVERPYLPRWMKQKLLLETFYFSRYGNSHFDRAGVFSRQKLFGLASYARSVDPELAVLLHSRLIEGSRLDS
jgi:RNA-directed DNA polymerase